MNYKEENIMQNKNINEVSLKTQVSKAVAWGENWRKLVVENDELNATEIWMLHKVTGKGILWLREYHLSEEEMMG